MDNTVATDRVAEPVALGVPLLAVDLGKTMAERSCLLRLGRLAIAVILVTGASCAQAASRTALGLSIYGKSTQHSAQRNLGTLAAVIADRSMPLCAHTL